MTKTAEQYSSVTDYLKRYCPDYTKQAYVYDRQYSPYLNYSLMNMHTKACFDYVLKHINQKQLKEIISTNGLPTPLLIESNLSALMKKSALNPGNLVVIFDDLNLLNDWVINLLVQIEPSLFQRQTNVEPSVIISDKPTTKKFINFCLTPEESDFIEIFLLSQEIEYVRNDEMSLMTDPVINTVIYLYLFLNNSKHHLFLTNVVSQNIEGYHSSAYLLKLAQAMMDVAYGKPPEIEIPTSLKFITDLCKCYKKGVTFESLVTFLTVLVPEHGYENQERIETLKNFLLSGAFIDCSNFNTSQPLNLINSLTSPVINVSSTLISKNVPLEHLRLSGPRIRLINIR
ncbi:hypothetical protein [Thalassotalea piscium]|uniref:Uncharacterized protein n=1 Tax=Thalassotalea piscium TaxID=1230533 RepID=A0A7X0NGI9_9GAMM|nr:hypothetical protein [Thalassotalea piscium]MBB6543039.1 hypothetical protein [Thalassotalea piscium]